MSRSAANAHPRSTSSRIQVQILRLQHGCRMGCRHWRGWWERGPEIEAVVDVLETWIEKCSGDIILEKWVHDILEAAQGAILVAGKDVN
ncbi:uncharacterized protein F5891DRAFT_1017791 [Suillus fuscotomentosus]|uniref:Uncharacterized protein n=1 Tax=Suillus fuscotomentosus TaxID=1912939 RepID=A0AAD4HP60_9AGAM|nr:uncharacterized protein F5891DRAFT_1017791 [Suillus fuscotomentosus]KAG1903672.1 hypothetical protein F5891DRAFT_1017791 [Suillus fuscotomentosus]